MDQKLSTRNIAIASFGIAGVISGGTLSLSAFGGVSIGDALYDTLHIMLSHFSHHDYTDPLSRTVIIILILLSYGAIAYLLKMFADYAMGLSDNVRKHNVRARVKKLKNHYIICGLGRVGYQVARELASEGVPFVALDRDANKVAEALKAGFMAMQLDSTEENALEQVGIEKASGIVAGLGDDSHNLLVTLAARAANHEIYIVARANRPENEIKLKRAGADRVAMPYQIGGYHMASMVLRPNVVDYLDVVPGSKGGNALEVEEMIVGASSPLVGRRLGQVLSDNAINATIIAINGADGTSCVRPTGKEKIYAGDRLIVLGPKKDLTEASVLIR